MSSPDLIQALTESYYEMLEKDANQDGVISEQEEMDEGPITKGVESIKEIFNAERIVEKIDKDLNAGEYSIVCLTGAQGSGKSTIARTLAHTFHQKGFVISYSSGFDVLDAPEKTVALAQNNKNILVIIDDASYIFGSVSGRASSRLKNWFGVIRHSLGGARVALLIITHVQTGIPPILRNSHFWIYSSPNASEYDAITRITGKYKKAREELESIYKSVTDIQNKGLEDTDLVINYKGHRYSFKWGNKTDPGDGRIMMAVINGKPRMYNSVNEFCDVCKAVCFTPTVKASNYTNLNKSKDEIAEAQRSGTQ